jgi:hypothetical protein
MTSTDDDDSKIVQFPLTAKEREELRKARQEDERRRLIDLFVDEAGGSLFRTPDGDCYADLIIEGVRQTWLIKSKKFRAEYIRYLRRQADRLFNSGAPFAPIIAASTLRKARISTAFDNFELKAISSPVEREVHVRVARDADHLYIDLGDPQWRAVRVGSSGWSVVESPPVRFRRPLGMSSLPMPVRGGRIEALRPFLNSTASDFTLAVAYLLAALYPHGPYPVLALYGEQGAAKTNFLRRLRRLIDPNLVEVSRLPLNTRDLVVAARNTHFLGFQNVSKLSDTMSDDFCQLATGGGLRLRTPFKDTDETLFRGARPIALEGINYVIAHGDLQSRSLIFELPAIDEYKTERELLSEFEPRLPGIFGALLDMMARGLERLPTTRIAKPPRMADFAYWATACGVEGFEAAYDANRSNAIEVMLSHDPLAKEVRALAAKQGKWTGVMEDLLNVVGPTALIKSTKKLSDDLRRLAPMLRSTGIEVVYEQRTETRRPLRIERMDRGED